MSWFQTRNIGKYLPSASKESKLYYKKLRRVNEDRKRTL
jgi:hypothetical protein